MRKNFFLLFLLFSTLVSKAQFSLTSQKDANKIKNVILLVAFEEEDEKVLKKYAKKPEVFEVYAAQIKGKNAALKYAAENYWTFSSEIEYMGEKAARELIAKEKDKYVMLHYGKFEDFQYEKTGTGRNGQPAGWTITHHTDGSRTSTYNTSTKYTKLTNVISTLEISGVASISKIFMPNFYPSQSDVVCCIQMMQYVLRYLTEALKTLCRNLWEE